MSDFGILLILLPSSITAIFIFHLFSPPLVCYPFLFPPIISSPPFLLLAFLPTFPSSLGPPHSFVAEKHIFKEWLKEQSVYTSVISALLEAEEEGPK